MVAGWWDKQLTPWENIKDLSFLVLTAPLWIPYVLILAWFNG